MVRMTINSDDDDKRKKWKKEKRRRDDRDSERSGDNKQWAWQDQEVLEAFLLAAEGRMDVNE